MTAPDPRLPAANARTGKAAALSVLIVVQAVCAGVFLLDIGDDLGQWDLMSSGPLHYGVELAAVAVMLVGIGLTAVEVRRLVGRQREVESQLRAASGAFHELLEEHFERWALTPAERDVAFLALKGLSIAEIAEIRSTRAGTVKAQCAAIYAKAGVSGRSQLLSVFVDELFGDGGLARRPEPQES